MGVFGLLAWQWQGYSRYHQSRANLLGRIVLVPLFLAGNVPLIEQWITFPRFVLTGGWWRGVRGSMRQ